MTVIVNEDNQTKPFSKVKDGEVFRFSRFGKASVYMKLRTPIVDDTGNDFNCVSMDQATLSRFADEDIVDIVNGAFVEDYATISKD